MSEGKQTDLLYEFMGEHKILLTCTLTSVVGLLALKRYMGGGVCRSKARLDNKTVLITGANTGLGKETAADLASRGARVLIACRDLSKAEKALEEIKNRSRNKNVEIYKLDLASLKSVRECASEVIEKEPRLDILINNAGVMQTPKGWKTEDGFERQIGTNHFGHFLFTHLLLDLLKKSAPSRIINVSSLAHAYGKMDFEDINLENNYDPWKAYAQSKLANVLYTRELSKRLEGSGVTANSLHPGVIPTELGRHRNYTLLKKILMYPIKLLLLKDVVQGSQTTIYCAVAEELEGVSGKYFSDCAVKAEASQAKNDKDAAKLWTLSEEMVGLKSKS